jgi:4-hydroxybenzoate polyprenyltransferase
MLQKYLLQSWLVVLIATLIIVQFYVLNYKWWWSAIYSAVFIVIPLLYIFKVLFQANKSSDFHRLSSVVKAAMLTVFFQ